MITNAIEIALSENTDRTIENARMGSEEDIQFLVGFICGISDLTYADARDQLLQEIGNNTAIDIDAIYEIIRELHIDGSVRPEIYENGFVINRPNSSNYQVIAGIEHNGFHIVFPMELTHSGSVAVYAHEIKLDKSPSLTQDFFTYVNNKSIYDNRIDSMVFNEESNRQSFDKFVRTIFKWYNSEYLL